MRNLASTLILIILLCYNIVYSDSRDTNPEINLAMGKPVQYAPLPNYELTAKNNTDSTMTYFLLTGDEEANLDKLKSLLNDRQMPQIEKHRRVVRIEAENFRNLGGFKVEYGDRRASHRLNVGMRNIGMDSITTTFNDIYTVGGRYDVDVRYFDEKDGRSEFKLLVGGVQRGEPWTASADTGSWQSKTVADVPVKVDDEIKVEVRGDGGEAGKLDYVQLNYRAQVSNVSGSPTSLFSDEVIQTGVHVFSGDVIWRKPGSIGIEVALHLRRRGSSSSTSSD